MVAWDDWVHPDWRDDPFERDERRAREFDRLEDDRLRELELVDLLRERGSSLSGRGEGAHRVASAASAGSTPAPCAPRPESDEKEEAA